MVFWVVLAFVVGLAWVIFTAVAAGVCAENEDPFFFVSEVWDATEGKLNLAGRIICAAFISIACIPTWIVDLIAFLIIGAIACIVGAFLFIFKDRSKDKKDEPHDEEPSHDENECDGICGECPEEHNCMFGDAPRIDFDAIYNDKSID